MKRRDFLITTALGAGATVMLEGCGHQEERLIPILIPEEQLVPGMQYWTASVCRQCPAGCGILVKTMLGEGTETVEGREMRTQVRQAKKIEGNPEHPVNEGKLCARGQAGLQVLYNPDRVKGPLKRTGPRGSGQYREITWDDAINELATKLRELRETERAHTLLFLTGHLPGQTRALVERFMHVFGSPNLMSQTLFGDQVVREANRLTMGHDAFATYDLAGANYVLSFSAAILETWRSPVRYNLEFGEMRQGRGGLRGKLVHAEPRFSLTAANADEWLAVNPGAEGALAMGFAHVLLKEHLIDPATVAKAGTRFAEFQALALEQYDPERVAQLTGIAAGTIERIAREFATHAPSLAIGGDAAGAQTNGLFNLAAINALNALVGNLGQPGGVSFAPKPPFAPLPPLPRSVVAEKGLAQPPLNQVDGSSGIQLLADRLDSGHPYPANVVLLYEANPLFSFPGSPQLRKALEKVPLIVSFSSFKDDSALVADMILPDHTYLESWWDEVPDPGVHRATVGLAQPVVRPLYNTRGTADVLLQTAKAMSGEVGAAFPWERFEEVLRQAYKGLHQASGSAESFDRFWEGLLGKGGWWSQTMALDDRGRAKAGTPRFDFSPAINHQSEPVFAGDAGDYPFHLHIYQSTALLDGRGANQPWLQEMGDPMTTVAWGSWVEINPKTAEELGIREGDLVAVESPNGKVQAAALLFPGARPDTINMPVGQGHGAYGRYAQGRGANPIQLLAPLAEPTSGAVAWAATRVKISKAEGQGRLVRVGYSREE